MMLVPEPPSRRQSAFAGLVVLGAVIALLAIPEPPAQPAEHSSYHDKICAPGYAKSIRPPEHVTDRIKERMCLERVSAYVPLGKDYSALVRECVHGNELDHVRPLCLDGAPLDPANLQLQPWSEAHKKDKRETRACALYCRGEIDMPMALQIVRGK